MSKRIAIAVITGFFIIFNASATTVSFHVIETGISDEAGLRQSELWETAFMDVFFDAGYIVSNSPVMRIERKPSDILRLIDFEEAVDCGVDYLLVAQLDYMPNIAGPGEITFYIYKVSSQEKVVERSIPGSRPRVIRDEYENMKSIARGFVPYIGR